MSRFRGPRVRTLRALGGDLPGLTAKSAERRPYPPGQHGQSSGTRRKLSEYAVRLREKQKLCKNYGVTEGQLRKLVVRARGGRGPAGIALLSLLERRLDNLVFRAGFARTIPAARQLVSHGHVLVAGRRVDIPSYEVRTNQVIQLNPRGRALACVQAAADHPRGLTPDWLHVDLPERSAKLVEPPGEGATPFTINVQLVIEFYSQNV